MHRTMSIGALPEGFARSDASTWHLLAASQLQIMVQGLFFDVVDVAAVALGVVVAYAFWEPQLRARFATRDPFSGQIFGDRRDVM